MRAIRPSVSAYAILAACVAACGVGSTDDPIDPQVDAPPGAVNALGAPCTPPAGAECPADPAHGCVTFATIGDPNQGYCSPVCAADQDCADGYTGPATGQLTCLDQPAPRPCAIICTGNQDCPGTLTCQNPQGAPFSFCASPVQ